MARQQLQMQQSVPQQRCRITFAAINSLQPSHDVSEMKLAQEALANTVMAGLQLLPGFSQSHLVQPQQQLPFAWLQLPMQLPFLDSQQQLPQHSQQEGPVRRFPHPRQQDQQHSPSISSQSPRQDTASPADPPPSRNKLRTRNNNENPANAPGMVCVETLAGGRQRVYSIRRGVDKGRAWEGFDMIDDPETHHGRLLGLVRSYLLPQGFPDSVAPQYATYMTWRGVQYLFGGAMSVFTTKCLLTSLGVAGRHSGEAAAAINWVLKDGAGRLGRFLFARWGRELDCELKQFRLAGDLLMEAGAALELSTILAPRAFLPLACSANLAKNLAAVAASSTRAPIYRTFALQNNLADITAKGESVANLADIIGTIAGILLSKWRLPMVPTFVCLSAGYLVASRKEVDSVELPYLNRARLAYTATKFLESGVVPSVPAANHSEPLLPWGPYHQGRVVLGSTVEAACAAPADLNHAAALFKNEKFILCYRQDKKKVHVLLRNGVQPVDCLKAAFSAHVFLHMLEQQRPDLYGSSNTASSSSSPAAASSSASSTSTVMTGGDSAAAKSRGRRWGWGKNKDKIPVSTTTSTAAAAVPSLTGAALLRETFSRLSVSLPWSSDPGPQYYHHLLERSKSAVDSLYSDFTRQAERQGWRLSQTMLNPREARMMKLQLTPLTT